jgi:hypothetical protein
LLRRVVWQKFADVSVMLAASIVTAMKDQQDDGITSDFINV